MSLNNKELPKWPKSNFRNQSDPLIAQNLEI